MPKVNIFCTTINYYEVINNFPSYIYPLGLGNNQFPIEWLSEKEGKNILNLNSYYGELSGFYWVWKNKIKNMNDDEIIGFCHYRKLWMNKNKDYKNKLSFKSIYSELLDEHNNLLKQNDVIQVKPIIFKNKNLLQDFQEVHKSDALNKSLYFLNIQERDSFKTHLLGNIFYPLNMFITKKKIFEDYCEILFPWLHKCYEYCCKNNLLIGYNNRLPAFLGERFTSYWFSKIKKKTTLNYARLGNFFLKGNINTYLNTLKLPFTSTMYPTLHDY